MLYPGSTIAAAWSAGGSRLDLFGRGTESALWQKTFTWTQGWGPWTARTTPDTLTSNPTAVVYAAPVAARVFFRGTDNRSNGSPTPTAPGHPAPTTVSGMGAISPHPPPRSPTPRPGGSRSTPAATAASCAGGPTTMPAPGDTWTVTGSSLASAPVAASSSAGQVQVTVRDHNDHLIVWQNRDGAWKQADLGTPPAAAGTAIAQAPMPGTHPLRAGTTGTLPPTPPRTHTPGPRHPTNAGPTSYAGTSASPRLAPTDFDSLVACGRRDARRPASRALASVPIDKMRTSE